MNRILAILALCVFSAAAVQAADGVNFVSGNKNNDGQYEPRTAKTIQRKTERQPGFWDKEWKRSGLDQTIGGPKWNPFADAGNYMKKKSDAYRDKHPAGTDR